MSALSLSLVPQLSIGSLAPVPELAFALQVASVGAAIGAAIALRARRRDADADAWRITTAWATLGLVIGAGIVAMFAL